jgi:integrase
MAGLCKRAGIRSFGFHALRRFVASVLDSKNVPLKQIQLVLGHSNTTITDRYISNLQTDMKSTMDLLKLDDKNEKARNENKRHENRNENGLQN